MSSKLNLFTNFISLSIKNRGIVLILIIYELIPIIVHSGIPLVGEKNYMEIILKYISQDYHLELINSQLANDCPWGNITITSNSTIASTSAIGSKFPFLIGKNTINLAYLTLNADNCLFNYNLHISFYSLFLFLNICLFTLSRTNTVKIRYSKCGVLILKIFTILSNLIIRSTLLIFLIIFLNYIFYLIRFSGLTTYTIPTNSFFFIAVSFICLPIILLISFILIKKFRFFLRDYVYDNRQANFDSTILILKIIIAIDVNMRKYFFTGNYLQALQVLFNMIVLTICFYEILFNEYVTNLGLNCVKLGVIFYSSLLILSSYLNSILNTTNINVIIMEYILFLILTCFCIHLKYRKTNNQLFITHTGKLLKEKGINAVFRGALRYVLNYTGIEKDNIKFNNESLKSRNVNQNLSLLNLHYWNCQMKLNNRCPICKASKKYIIDKMSDTNGSNISSLLLNENPLLQGLYDFVIWLKEEFIHEPYPTINITVDGQSLSNAEILQELDVTEIFLLKMSILKIIDKQLNRRIISCSLMQQKYPKVERVQLSAGYLKFCIKRDNQEAFGEYDSLKLQEELLTNLNTILKMSNSFIEELVIHEVVYSRLLTNYLQIGKYHHSIKQQINIFSHSVKDDKAALINFIAAYKFIFNTDYDRSIAQLYDIYESSNVHELEKYYRKDRILTIDFDMFKNALTVVKTPGIHILTNIFDINDLGSDLENFFPKVIKKVERKRLIDKIISNKVNIFPFDTYLVDKKLYHTKVRMIVHTCLTVENKFRIQCDLTPIVNNSIIIHSNGRIHSFSKSFHSQFFLHPKVLLYYPKLNILDFLQEFYHKDAVEIINPDFSDKKEIEVCLNLEEYKLRFKWAFSCLEKVPPSLYMKTLGLTTTGDEGSGSNQESGQKNHFTFKGFKYRAKTIMSENNELSQKQEQHLPTILKKFIFIQVEQKVTLKKEVALIYEFEESSEKAITKLLREGKRDQDDSDEEGKKEEFTHNDNSTDKCFYDNYPENTLITNSSTSSQKSYQETQKKLFGKDTNKFSVFMKNSNRIKKFYYYIIIFNIVIILMAIIFLLIVQAQLSNISTTFAVIQDFKLERYSVYSLFLGAMTFIRIRDWDVDTQPNFYLPSISNNATLQQDLITYLNQELFQNLDSTDNLIKSTNMKIDSSFAADYITSDVNLQTELFSFSDNNNGYLITNSTLFDLLQLYVNAIQSFANNQKMYLDLDIINLSNNASYIKEMNSYFLKSGSDHSMERNIITILINFFGNIDSKMTQVEDNFEVYQLKSIRFLLCLIYFFMFLLLLSDVIILLLTIWLLYIYKSQVIIVMSVIYTVDFSTLKAILGKNQLIKNLLNMLENPIQLVKQLKKFAKKNMNNNVKKGLIRKHANEKKDKEELEVRVKENGKLRMVRDQGFILKYFLNLFLILLGFNVVYFTLGFVVIGGQIGQMNLRVNFTEAFVKVLDFPLKQLTQVKSTLMLNKTNLSENYFTQQIDTDFYFTISEKLDQNIKFIQYTLQNSAPYFPTAVSFLESLQGNTTCSTLIKFSQTYIKKPYYTPSLQAILADIASVCSYETIMKTNFFTVLEFFNIKLRETVFKYVASEKNVTTIRNIYLSKELGELDLIATLLLKPLFYESLSNVLIPGFDSDLSRLLICCYIILILNILMNFLFLFIENRMILNKCLENVDNLNILFQLLT